MESVWIALGGNAAFLLVVAFLGRSVVRHWLDKDIDDYRSRLQRAGASDLERLRAELQSAAGLELEKLRGAIKIAEAEHSILLSRLQDRRATVIDGLYEKLADAIRDISSFVNIMERPGEPTKQEKGKIAANSYNEFIQYFDRKIVWLPEECATKVEALRAKMLTAFISFDMWRSVPDDSPRAEDKIRAWSKAWEDMTRNEIPPARKALEDTMRGLLEPTRRAQGGESSGAA